jgi:CheY-like chemotaxis protein
MMNKVNCVLLIDDDYSTNFLNKKVVEKADCSEHIQVTSSAEEALDYLQSKGKFSENGDKFPQPGLVFLDINMPGMDGWDFLEEYKKLPREKKGRIVISMLTTSLNPEDRARAGSISEVDHFLTKPLTADAIQAIVNTYYPEG